ncbi:MAG: GNAT family N-acetyltransferase [Chloroflexota bacterium]|nr:GNAT family N-acetyltransferase [Chloroflexota bacterium]
MTTRPLTLHAPDLLQRSAACSRRSTFETVAGPLILRSFCSPSLVTSLKADGGLHAFTHVPEREHQLLLGIAERPDCALTLAYTPDGEIVGQVTLTPADTWWQGVTNTYELAIEVSTHWRRLGVARQLLSLALEFDAVEKMNLVALGLSWHWDFKEAGLSPFRYRSLVTHVLESYHFFECLTDEPNVAMDPTNILLVRIGKNVEREVMDQLFQRLRFF